VSADEDHMKAPEPTEEHRWLLRLVGEWTYEIEASMGPDKPPMKSVGEQSNRALGQLWLLGEGRTVTPNGDPGVTMMTLGYDPAKKKVVGTFIASMMTHLWPYEGMLDADRKVLTLDSEGPSFADPTKNAPYQDIFELVSDDHYILRSRAPGPDGEWVEFMEGHYRRKR